MIDPARVLPVGSRPRRSSLRTLTEAWAMRGTGTVRSPVVSDAHLVSGEGTDVDDPDRLARAVCAPELEFVSEEVEHVGMTVPLGGLMMEAARLLGCPNAVTQSPRVRLRSTDLYKRVIHRIPLATATRAVLGHAVQNHLTLGEALRMEGLGAGVVADDLAALVTLGLIELDTPESERADALVPFAPTPVDLPAFTLTEAEEKALKGRLEREWAMVRDVDDWTVLGLQPGAARVRIEAAARRMNARYRTVVDDPLLGQETHEVAQRLFERSQKAARRLLAGITPDAPPAVSGASEALDRGWKAVEREDFVEARRCFALARRDPRGQSSGLAGEGWIDVVDPRSTMAERQEGLELLSLAYSMAPGDPRILTLLREARVEMGLRATMPDE